MSPKLLLSIIWKYGKKANLMITLILLVLKINVHKPKLGFVPQFSCMIKLFGIYIVEVRDIISWWRNTGDACVNFLLEKNIFQPHILSSSPFKEICLTFNMNSRLFWIIPRIPENVIFFLKIVTK